MTAYQISLQSYKSQAWPRDGGSIGRANSVLRTDSSFGLGVQRWRIGSEASRARCLRNWGAEISAESPLCQVLEEMSPAMKRCSYYYRCAMN